MNITELIEKVREIDEESADYLAIEVRKLPDFNYKLDYSVLNLLSWDRSPQGFYHWRAVSDLLGE